MSDICVVAMGGNSLLDPSDQPTVANQFAITAQAIRPIAALVARGERLLLTHGNGPQVGFMQLRSDLCRPFIHEVPLDSLVADTQGAIGYMVQQTLREELRHLRIDIEIAAIVTEVKVDPRDSAFANPTKPVGKFYSEEEAQTLRRDRGWAMIEDSKRGFRRVVPSPAPLDIVQLPTIKRLAESGVLVIACGGGGIPIVHDEASGTRGVEAVIDKDLATALLASRLEVERLVITTGVDAIYRDYLDPGKRTPLRRTTPAELKALTAAGHFPPGSMGPKAAAAIYFLEHGGEEVLVCKPEALVEAFDGHGGTTIYPEKANT